MRRLVLLGVIILPLVVGLVAQSPARALTTKGSLPTGGVSVFFGDVLFGQVICQQVSGGYTLVFRSTVKPLPFSTPEFGMNVEFLREIVAIADAEYAKAPCKAADPVRRGGIR